MVRGLYMVIIIIKHIIHTTDIGVYIYKMRLLLVT